MTQMIKIRTILISIALTIVLAIANIYLALKIGFLTSASIPAAILSMSILRFFKNSTIYENNLIQTAASAGEAVAGGVVYTLPGLIIIGYWTHFDYLQTFFMAFIGGLLGILFSIPLRKKLVTSKELPFPEATAIAEVLQANTGGKTQLKLMVSASIIGATFDFAQNGLKLIASHFQKVKMIGGSLFNFEMGFSPTMIAAGYLIGFGNGLSLFLGSIIAWYVTVPILHTSSISSAGNAVHYIGIGAMLTAALFTLFTLLISFANKIKAKVELETTLEDLPGKLILLGLLGIFILTFIFFNQIFDLSSLGASQTLIVLALLFTFIMGFIAVVTACYFSGLVGVSASPGSSIVIACVLIATFGLKLFFAHQILSAEQLTHLAGIIIIVISVVMAAACIANDNSQDLKVGYLIGAKPWQQQLMLMLGVLVSSLLLPLIMDKLFYAYGIVNVMPRPGMDAAMSLSAPPANAIVGTVQSILGQNLPWNYLGIGAAIVAAVMFLQIMLKRFQIKLSVICVAIGIYLPLTSTMPMFLGACVALFANHKFKATPQRNHLGTILACGLITGSALMDVLLAFGSSLNLGLSIPPQFALLLAIVFSLAVCIWFYTTSNKNLTLLESEKV